MSQRPSVESQQSSSPPVLTPALQAALATLDVQLDEELARYRRDTQSSDSIRPGQMYSGRGLGRRPVKPLDLISIGATGGRTQPQASTTAPPPPPVAPPPQTQSQQPPVAPPPPTQRQQPPVAPPPPTQSQQPQTSPPSPRVPLSLPMETAQATSAEIPPTPTPVPPEELPSGESSNLARQVATPDGENIVDPTSDRTLSRAQSDRPHPDDYLESSEALLRSLAEEQNQPQTEPSTNDSPLTPLGIGSMLLLLLASATLGYVAINPSSWRYFTFNRTPTIAEQPKGVAPSTSRGEAPPLPNSPNLAAREFVELNLNTITTLKATTTPSPSPQPSPAAATAPPVTISPITPPVTTILPPQSTVPGVPPSPVRLQPLTRLTPPPQLSGAKQVKPTATQKPAAAKTAQKPAKELIPDEAGYYHIVTDYKGDRSLSTARGAVPDAYLSPKKTLIYLGSVKSKDKAKSQVAQLNQKGIPARIYQP